MPEALGRINGATLAATVDPVLVDPGGVAGVAHYSTLAELRDADYDAVVVAVPHDLALPLLGGGRAVLIEKPLGMCGADAREIYDSRGRPLEVRPVTP